MSPLLLRSALFGENSKCKHTNAVTITKLMYCLLLAAALPLTASRILRSEGGAEPGAKSAIIHGQYQGHSGLALISNRSSQQYLLFNIMLNRTCALHKIPNNSHSSSVKERTVASPAQWMRKAKGRKAK